MDCSPPGSSIHEISQARILEWVAFPSLGVLANPGIKLASPESPALAGGFFSTEPPGKRKYWLLKTKRKIRQAPFKELRTWWEIKPISTIKPQCNAMTQAINLGYAKYYRKQIREDLPKRDNICTALCVSSRLLQDLCFLLPVTGLPWWFRQ